MKEKLKKITQSKMFHIILLIVLIGLIIGVGTYAWFTWSSTDNTNVTLSIGNLIDVSFAKGPDINTNDLAPVFYYTDGEKANFSINSKVTDATISYYVKLNVTNIDNELKNKDFQYKLVSNENIISEGNFSNVSNGTTLNLVSETLTSGKINYTLYLYIDGNVENNPNMMNKNFSGTIEVGASLGPTETGSETISNLFSETKKVTNNSVTYSIDETHNLIKDNAENIRYYGQNPNNYINIGDNELWRIVGVFKNVELENGTQKDLIKIMRSSKIGDYSWDTSATSVNSGWGINEWSQADSMKLINPNFSGTGGSLWYESQNGSCYTGRYEAATSCNFNTTGLTAAAKENIETVKWYTGGSNTNNIYSNAMYTAERSNSLITNYTDNTTRNATWIGKVGLPYPSDYGYATDFSICSSNLNSYNSTGCKSNDWIYNIMTSNGTNGGWFITPVSSSAYISWSVNSSGSAYYSNYGDYTFGITPTMYLKDTVSIDDSHTGSNTDPYTIGSGSTEPGESGSGSTEPGGGSSSDAENKEFNYTGGEQTFIASKAGTYKLEVWGAQGGSYNETYYGGYGGYSVGNISLTSGEKLYIYVGGAGSLSNSAYSGIVAAQGGYNGGGAALARNDVAACSGGGATHIAKRSGLLSTLSSSSADIIIVAGGGGGASAYTGTTSGWGGWGGSSNRTGSAGGSGGGFQGVVPTNTCTDCGTRSGGSQTSGGVSRFGTASFGQGLGSTTQATCGGGGGYYGGSGDTYEWGATGGSGYLKSTLTNKSMYCYNCTTSNDTNTKTVSVTNTSETATANYAKKGNGYAKITFVN